MKDGRAIKCKEPGALNHSLGKQLLNDQKHLFWTSCEQEIHFCWTKQLKFVGLPITAAIAILTNAVGFIFYTYLLKSHSPSVITLFMIFPPQFPLSSFYSHIHFTTQSPAPRPTMGLRAIPFQSLHRALLLQHCTWGTIRIGSVLAKGEFKPSLSSWEQKVEQK